MRLTNSKKIATVLAIPVVFVFRVPLFNILTKILKDSVVVGKTGAFTLFLVFCIIYVFLIMYNENADDHQNGMINLFYLACVCQAFGSIYQLPMRVGYYFMVYGMIAIPNTVANINDIKSRRTMSIVISVAFILFGLNSLATATWAGTNPYIFFWQN